MDFGIAGKIALVTGGTQGIGLAVAKGLAAEGLQVVVSSRNEAHIQEAITQITQANGKAVGIPADVSMAKDIQMLFEETRSEVGDPDILVCNAGGPPRGTALETSDASWARGYELTLMSAIRLARRALPAMQESGWGRIINITSVSVKQPVANLTLSNAFRAAVTGFAKTLSSELASNGITVNNVAPGYTDTERLNELFGSEDAKHALMESVPMKRFATPEEVAAVAVFLASQQAAYLTGQTISVDGGALKAVF